MQCSAYINLIPYAIVYPDREGKDYLSMKIEPFKIHIHVSQYRINSGKLSREKTFTNFAIFQPSAKVFSMKFLACHTHYATDFNIPRKFSIAKP